MANPTPWTLAAKIVPPYLQYEVYGHTSRVKNLYKRCYRTLESYMTDRPEFRYYARKLRHEFDLNKGVSNLVEARRLVDNGYKEWFQEMHYDEFKFVDSPGGVAFDRNQVVPDCSLDFWHPLEKSEYPDYFARREQRKLEYIDYYNKVYGKDAPIDNPVLKGE